MLGVPRAIPGFLVWWRGSKEEGGRPLAAPPPPPPPPPRLPQCSRSPASDSSGGGSKMAQTIFEALEGERRRGLGRRLFRLAPPPAANSQRGAQGAWRLRGGGRRAGTASGAGGPRMGTAAGAEVGRGGGAVRPEQKRS